MQKYYTHHAYKGFTLIETLVAIAVLLFVIMGPMTIAQKGIQNAYYAEEQVTAVFLAQEAIEAVREFRDAKALDVLAGTDSVTSSWASGICTGECAYNASSNTFYPCSGDECVLRYSEARGYYYQAVGDLTLKSPFSRKVTIGAASNGGVPVTVTVSWNAKVLGGTKNVVLQTWVYDHYRRYEP